MVMAPSECFMGFKRFPFEKKESPSGELHSPFAAAVHTVAYIHKGLFWR